MENAAIAVSDISDGPARSNAGEVILRAPAAGDLGWVIHRQAILYAREYGWNQQYEALVATILGGFAADPIQPANRDGLRNIAAGSRVRSS
jgi:hypothetical protein